MLGFDPEEPDSTYQQAACYLKGNAPPLEHTVSFFTINFNRSEVPFPIALKQIKNQLSGDSIWFREFI